jgi:hypothetical protein
VSGVFTGGALFALILAFLPIEFLALAAYYRRTGRGIPPRLLLGDIGAGMALLAAALAALCGAWWPFIGAALLAALGAHLFDLTQRWK